MLVEYLLKKGSGRLNEDCLAARGNLFAVFDGATELVRSGRPAAKSGGWWAAHLARKIVLAARPHDSLKLLARRTNAALRQAMRRAGVDQSRPAALWGTTAAAVKLSRGALSWLQIGDSLIMLIYGGGRFRVLGKNYEHDAATLRLWQSLARKKERNLWGACLPQLIKVRNSANVIYGVINGQPQAEKFFHCGRTSLTGVKHLLLFTDGLFLPKINPNAPEDFDGLSRLYLSGGLRGVAAHIRRLHASDPKTICYPRFGRFSDTAAIVISF